MGHEKKRQVEIRHVVINENKFSARSWRTRYSNKHALDSWYKALYPDDQVENDDNVATEMINDLLGIGGDDSVDGEQTNVSHGQTNVNVNDNDLNDDEPTENDEQGGV